MLVVDSGRWYFVQVGLQVLLLQKLSDPGLPLAWSANPPTNVPICHSTLNPQMVLT